MGLTVRRAGTDDYGRYINCLVVGEPGAGKTRSSSTWPNPIYASAEGGMMSVADRQPAVVDITSSHVLLELRNILVQEPKVREQMLGVPCDTVILDTVDELSRILIRERLEREKKDTLAIADWGWLGDQLRNIVRGFRNLDLHTVFLVHAKNAEDSETGRIITKAAIQGAMGDEIAGYVDIAVLLTARPMTKVVNGQNVREIVRFWQTYPTPNAPWVKDRSGKLPPELAINFEDDFKRLEDLVYGGGATTTIPTIVAATATVLPAQVKEEKPVSKEEAVIPPVPPPDPQPEPPAPEPLPEPEPAPPAPSPVEPSTASTEVAAPVETVVEMPAIEEAPKEASTPVCKDCGEQIETRDIADISFIRFRRPLCRKCFIAAKGQTVAAKG
jgi:AAA domain-containing protein